QAIQIKRDQAQPHNNLGDALAKKGVLDEAIKEYGEAIRIKEDYPEPHNGLAWILSTCPDARLRDPGRAVAAATKAVKLDPTLPHFWQTLGWAEYRAGNWQAAIRALDKVKELGSPGDSLVWFPLAMAHWRLGHKDEARRWYDRAVEWMDKNNP